jgi:hypothetical protein
MEKPQEISITRRRIPEGNIFKCCNEWNYSLEIMHNYIFISLADFVTLNKSLLKEEWLY